MNILAISGSLRAGSHSTRLLRTAAGLTDLHLWNGLATIPPFNEDHEDEPPQAVSAMRAEVARADALLIATPEYNGTIPGQLKNALDWMSRPYLEGVLVDKPVAVAGVSPSDYGAEWSQRDLRKVLEVCGARVVGRSLCVPRADTAFDENGQLRDPAAQTTLAAMVDELRALAEARKAVLV
ncbi:NADPH-dependent FMN reductase [Kibdelosporangium persicum]|uniref:FMN-dependent NADPH-azoreductase n=1 Tax=Kibdelosporangium persicum TaxID=2698649 RepID=A0ABX2FH97_9PSEU|nr:NADPH-dependent FMN reductase [Kibdelosporangium persicum]NRN70778.1 FMN-dependent NADPH-azoreductase [Kibdelosporangium persicum]